MKTIAVINLTITGTIDKKYFTFLELQQVMDKITADIYTVKDKRYTRNLKINNSYALSKLVKI